MCSVFLSFPNCCLSHNLQLWSPARDSQRWGRMGMWGRDLGGVCGTGIIQGDFLEEAVGQGKN